MNFQNTNISLQRIAKDIAESVEEDLIKVGIFYRIFHRVKSTSSVDKKILNKKYDGVNTFLRDVIGIRVVFYFADDLDCFYKLVKEKYADSFVEESKDLKKVNVFEPERINIVFKLPKEFRNEFGESIKNAPIDYTYELQLRTIFSEGWHEIEHDLRYKNKTHWEGHSDLSRTLNGILAALETNDWTIIALFDQLAYKHYKSTRIDAMVRTKFRLRFAGDDEMNSKLIQIISENSDIRKELFKINRVDFLYSLACKNIKFPLSIDNVIYYLNHTYLKNESISLLTPKPLLNNFINR